MTFSRWSPFSSSQERMPRPAGTAPGLPTSQLRRVAARLVVLATIGLALWPVHAESSAPDDAKAAPLRGSIQLRIDDPANPRRRNLRLDQPGALPLRAHDRFRIEARLNRPAYLYLFWVGSDGKVGPIYPWTSRDWDRAAQELKTAQLDLPRQAEKAWAIPAGDPGLDTVVLLAREQSPLPIDRDTDLAKLSTRLPAPSRQSPETAVWIENGREVTLDEQNRAAPSGKTRKSDDPVLRLRRLLREKLQPMGNYSQAVLFPNQGGR